jgi:hypothetical protein
MMGSMSTPTRSKVNVLLPCATFFAAGKGLAGAIALLMQASVVLWPVAYRMARQLNEADAVDRKLSELSSTYKLPNHAIFAAPSKRFRQAA